MWFHILAGKTFVTREIHHLRSFDIDSFFHASLSFSLFCCLLLFDAVPNRLLNKDFNELPNMGMTRKKLSQKAMTSSRVFACHIVTRLSGKNGYGDNN